MMVAPGPAWYRCISMVFAVKSATIRLFASGTFRLILLLALLTACTKERKSTPEPASLDELELLEPDTGPSSAQSRCRVDEKFRSELVRARSSEDSDPRSEAFVDIGNAVVLGPRFFVGGLRGAGSTRAFVAQIDGSGHLKTWDLSAVHGSVEVPMLSAWDPFIFFVLSDNDATRRRLRLGRLDPRRETDNVIWGPEVTVGRGADLSFSLALPSKGNSGAGVLSWDDFERSSQRSSIRLLTFSPETLRETSAVRVASSPGEDAVVPSLVPSESGYFLLWLRYVTPNQEGKGSDLIDEPPRELCVQRLESRGTSVGDVLELPSSKGSVLAYAAASFGGNLLVAAREAPLGRSADLTEVALISLGRDGSFVRERWQQPQLGMGAPLLLPAPPKDPWLVAIGREEEMFLGAISNDLAGSLKAESQLVDHIPLARSQDALLAMKADGLDLQLSLFRCALTP
jgi:hypothetical protein